VIINLTALILYGYALYQLIGALFSPPRHAWWLTLMVLGLGWQPVLASLRHANLSLIISSLVLLCWYFMRRGREALGGVILGLAISLKIHPCILLVYLIGKRWRAFAAAVITTAFFAVVAWLCVGSQDVLRFVATTRFLTKTFGRSRDNASVFSVIFGVTHLDESSIIGTVILGGVAVLFVIFAMWAINSKAQRGSSPAEREDTNFAIAICLMSLISPIVWPHYFSVMLLPLALIAKYGAEWSQDGIKKIGFLVLVLVLSLPDQPLAAVSHALRSQFGDQLGWFLGSFQTFALLGVMVWLVTIRTRPAIGDVNAQTG
jgi:hypothetical protein